MGTFIADENGVILKCNSYFLELLGYDSDFLEKFKLANAKPYRSISRDLDMIKKAMRASV